AMFQYYDAVSGVETSVEDQTKLGFRRFPIRAPFNIRRGLRRESYTISDRSIGNPPLTGGPLEGVTVDVEKLADNFFEALGWDVATGVPTKQALEALGGLEFAIKDLHP
ncbi:MAG: hypothetical protein FWC90_05370, partial [Oscillospiraceae bacterium]|nr:hypothetical protein [Oscillospiraceae bacterium]